MSIILKPSSVPIAAYLLDYYLFFFFGVEWEGGMISDDDPLEKST